ncbi:hypothetical protein GJ496_001300 [Pomphorhynchus laevis]|nr:hypothetical protein GJ496_001300 [Pomphorhynchus laevis]
MEAVVKLFEMDIKRIYENEKLDEESSHILNLFDIAESRLKNEWIVSKRKNIYQGKKLPNQHSRFIQSLEIKNFIMSIHRIYLQLKPWNLFNQISTTNVISVNDVFDLVLSNQLSQLKHDLNSLWTQYVYENLLSDINDKRLRLNMNRQVISLAIGTDAMMRWCLCELEENAFELIVMSLNHFKSYSNKDDKDARLAKRKICIICEWEDLTFEKGIASMTNVAITFFQKLNHTLNSIKLLSDIFDENMHKSVLKEYIERKKFNTHCEFNSRSKTEVMKKMFFNQYRAHECVFADDFTCLQRIIKDQFLRQILVDDHYFNATELNQLIFYVAEMRKRFGIIRVEFTPIIFLQVYQTSFITDFDLKLNDLKACLQRLLVAQISVSEEQKTGQVEDIKDTISAEDMELDLSEINKSFASILEKFNRIKTSVATDKIDFHVGILDSLIVTGEELGVKFKKFKSNITVKDNSIQLHQTMDFMYRIKEVFQLRLELNKLLEWTFNLKSGTVKVHDVLKSKLPSYENRVKFLNEEMSECSICLAHLCEISRILEIIGKGCRLALLVLNPGIQNKQMDDIKKTTGIKIFSGIRVEELLHNKLDHHFDYLAKSFDLISEQSINTLKCKEIFITWMTTNVYQDDIRSYKCDSLLNKISEDIAQIGELSNSVSNQEIVKSWIHYLTVIKDNISNLKDVHQKYQIVQALNQKRTSEKSKNYQSEEIIYKWAQIQEILQRSNKLGIIFIEPSTAKIINDISNDLSSSEKDVNDYIYQQRLISPRLFYLPDSLLKNHLIVYKTINESLDTLAPLCLPSVSLVRWDDRTIMPTDVKFENERWMQLVSNDYCYDNGFSVAHGLQLLDTSISSTIAAEIAQMLEDLKYIQFTSRSVLQSLSKAPLQIIASLALSVFISQIINRFLSTSSKLNKILHVVTKLSMKVEGKRNVHVIVLYFKQLLEEMIKMPNISEACTIWANRFKWLWQNRLIVEISGHKFTSNYEISNYEAHLLYSADFALQSRIIINTIQCNQLPLLYGKAGCCHKAENSKKLSRPIRNIVD